MQGPELFACFLLHREVKGVYQQFRKGAHCGSRSVAKPQAALGAIASAGMLYAVALGHLVQQGPLSRCEGRRKQNLSGAQQEE